MNRSLSFRFIRLALVPSVLLGISACGGGSESEPPNSDPTGPSPGPSNPAPGVFESSHPGGATESSRGTDESSADGNAISAPGASPNVGNPSSPVGAGPAGTTTPPLDTAGEPEVPAARAIEEADIVKLSGDRLYALSAIGGLSVIDVSDPDDLRVIGRHRTTASPFEMYVRDDSVFVLYNGYGEYTYDEQNDYYTYYQTSYVISLDTKDPSQISERQKFEIAGYISDSRLIGDVMYVVAFQDGYCYRCGTSAETNVLSLDVSRPQNIAQVDELTIPERQDSYSWSRSLSATQERLYIAGPRYGSGAEPEGSIIQVVDVSNGSGELVQGDSVQVAGQINSRWQMDEYEGVLRVISQPLWWRSGTAPSVETFEIVSSEEVVTLGRTELVLPRPETLQSVRFDGPRGYAITFEQTDPLFTIDLGDPANPRQMGELEIPGWVYHMEPRGDRVIGLGFDQGNPQGALTVSLFDVSDFSNPTMISRVNFGGDWAQLAEDQNRIHKSFQVLDEHELVLIPYSGWTYQQNANECGWSTSSYVSGVQLVDWSNDAFTLRGVAPSQGQARRALIREGRLLTMSDERFQSFDIDDRDAPRATSMVELAQIVNQVATVGDTVVRLGNSFWDQRGLEVTVSSLDELLAFEPGATVKLPDLNTETCNGYSYLRQMYSAEDSVFFLYDRYDYSGRGDNGMKVLTLDVSDPSAPEIAGDAELGFSPSYGHQYVPGMVNNGAAVVGVGKSLVFSQHDIQYNNLGYVTKSARSFEVVDFSNPQTPKRVSVPLPDALGSTGLLVSGSVVASSHFEVSPTNPDRVRFYLNRVDVSSSKEPEAYDGVNIPGSLLAYDHETERALTVDYQYVTISDISPKRCYEEEYGEFLTNDRSRVDYENARGNCAALRFTLHLVEIVNDKASLIGSHAVEKGVSITTAALGDDRVFLGTGTAGGYYYGGGIAPPAPSIGISSDIAIGGGRGFYYYHYGFQAGEAKLLVASGLGGGDLVVSSTLLETANNFYGFDGLLAKGQKAVVSTGWQGTLSVIDASDAENPTVHESVQLGGGVYDLDLSGNFGVAALGQAGVQVIDLGD